MRGNGHKLTDIVDTEKYNRKKKESAKKARKVTTGHIDIFK